MTPKAGHVKISLRLDQLNLFMRLTGILTNADLAKRMNSGVVESTVSRLRKNNYAPNAAIIAGLLNAFPAANFDDLFLVEDEDQDALQPAGAA